MFLKCGPNPMCTEKKKLHVQNISDSEWRQNGGHEITLTMCQLCPVPGSEPPRSQLHRCMVSLTCSYIPGVHSTGVKASGGHQSTLPRSLRTLQTLKKWVPALKHLIRRRFKTFCCRKLILRLCHDRKFSNIFNMVSNGAFLTTQES